MMQMINLVVVSAMSLSASMPRTFAFTPRQQVTNTMAKRHSEQSNSRLCSVPKLIVFDLDNTLWTPELYQLRTIARNKQVPVAHKDVKLFDGVHKLLQHIKSDPEKQFTDTKFAVASRTKSVDWAHSLLDQFELRDFFDYVEIFPGDKKQHFRNLARSSGLDYRDMLFFDDARDGKYGNCEPVASLGVLAVHTPNGIYEESIWHNALDHYREWSVNFLPGTIVEWDNSISSVQTVDVNKRQNGSVKFVNRGKRFGFIQHEKRGNKDIFFHFNDLPNGVTVEEGDDVMFSISPARNGKIAATKIEILGSTDDSDFIEMRTFSMNLPFAALLANGYKTIESRNGTMFTPYPEGTKMLLHVGQRIYPDGNRHIEVMQSGGLSDKEIKELKSLPTGFNKGMAVAIVEIGKTYETTLEQRCDPDYQRSVAAFGQDSGMRATEIKRVAYLKRGVKVSGQGGVFKVKVDKSIIPDGWLVAEESSTGTNKGYYYSATF